MGRYVIPRRVARDGSVVVTAPLFPVSAGGHLNKLLPSLIVFLLSVQFTLGPDNEQHAAFNAIKS